MSTVTVPVTIADSPTTSVWEVSSTAPVRTYPSEVTFFGNIYPGYRLLKPFLLTIERDEDGSFIFSDDIFDIYGHAFGLVDAAKDYFSALVEYYEILSRHTDAPTVALFQKLNRIFQPLA
jgi:hypothetical protein